jgi:hypothetical protein
VVPDNPIFKAELDCQIATKAVHNLQGAAYFCERLEARFGTHCTHDLAALFLSMVIQYARLFTPTKTQFGKRVMPIGTLKDVAGFDTVRHHHLIHLRDPLLAHDDLDEFLPRIMTTSLSVDRAKLVFPIEFYLSNKTLSHPDKIEIVTALTAHTVAALTGADTYMNAAMERCRQALIDHQDIAREWA